MIFPSMNEYEFATFFVVIKQEQIKQELGIQYLYMDMVIKIVYKYVLQHKTSIQSEFKNQYDSLSDEQFFTNILNILKKAQKNSIPLEMEIIHQLY